MSDWLHESSETQPNGVVVVNCDQGSVTLLLTFTHNSYWSRVITLILEEPSCLTCFVTVDMCSFSDLLNENMKLLPMLSQFSTLCILFYHI